MIARNALRSNVQLAKTMADRLERGESLYELRDRAIFSLAGFRRFVARILRLAAAAGMRCSSAMGLTRFTGHRLIAREERRERCHGKIPSFIQPRIQGGSASPP